jgi:hypothetical protein
MWRRHCPCLPATHRDVDREPRPSRGETRILACTKRNSQTMHTYVYYIYAPYARQQPRTQQAAARHHRSETGPLRYHAPLYRARVRSRAPHAPERVGYPGRSLARSPSTLHSGLVTTTGGAGPATCSASMANPASLAEAAARLGVSGVAGCDEVVPPCWPGSVIRSLAGSASGTVPGKELGASPTTTGSSMVSTASGARCTTTRAGLTRTGVRRRGELLGPRLPGWLLLIWLLLIWLRAWLPPFPTVWWSGECRGVCTGDASISDPRRVELPSSAGRFFSQRSQAQSHFSSWNVVKVTNTTMPCLPEGRGKGEVSQSSGAGSAKQQGRAGLQSDEPLRNVA